MDLGGVTSLVRSTCDLRLMAESSVGLSRRGFLLWRIKSKRDRVPRGTYQALSDAGTLHLATGLRVPPPRMLIELIQKTWGDPASIVCDRFRLDELRKMHTLPCRVESRVTRWSEASYDIRAVRSHTKGRAIQCVARDSRALLEASLSVAAVKNDDQGSVRLVKRTRNNESRDDVASGLLPWLLEPTRERLAHRSALFHRFRFNVTNRDTAFL